MKKTSKTHRLMLQADKSRQKRIRFNTLKYSAQTVGCGLWFASTRAQKRIKGLK